jgi:hypothetical protein
MGPVPSQATREYRVYPLPRPKATRCYVCRALRLDARAKGVAWVRRPEPLELPHCHTTQEIAKALKLSEKTVRSIFQDRPGVIKITKGRRLRGKREYYTLRITDTALAAWLRENGL